MLNAPERFVTLNRGMKMRAWYDIKFWEANPPIMNKLVTKNIFNYLHFDESYKLIRSQINYEVKKLDNDFKKIILAGFS